MSANEETIVDKKNGTKETDKQGEAKTTKEPSWKRSAWGKTTPKPSVKRGNVLPPRPIGVSSQPIIGSAAERILSQEGVGGPTGRFADTRRAVSSLLANVLPEDVSDAGGRAVAKAVVGAEELAGMAGDAWARAKDDDAKGVADVGHDVVSRLSAMVRMMSVIMNDGLADDAAMALSDALLWMDEGYLSAVADCGHEKAEKMSVRIRQIFDSGWAWLWDNAMSVAVPRPLSRDGQGKTLSMEAASELPGADPVTVAPVREVIVATERVIRGWDDMSLASMSSREMGRIADLIDAYARRTIGWPSDYPDHPLVTPPGRDMSEWASEQYWDILAGIGRDDVQGAAKEVEEEGPDGDMRILHTVRTNEEMHLPFAAWTYDCHQVAGRLASWAKSMGDDPAVTLSRSLMSPEDLAEIEGRAREAWDWLGSFVLDMRV